MSAHAFGISLERLRLIGLRHVINLARGEDVALTPLANDASIDPEEMRAFMKFRAIAALKAACRNDADQFAFALKLAAQLDRRGEL